MNRATYDDLIIRRYMLQQELSALEQQILSGTRCSVCERTQVPFKKKYKGVAVILVVQSKQGTKESMYHPLLTLETLDTLLIVSWASLLALLALAAVFPYIPLWLLPSSETTSVFLSIAFISLTVIRLGCGYRKLKNILLCCGLYYFLISVTLNGFFTRAVLGPIVWADNSLNRQTVNSQHEPFLPSSFFVRTLPRAQVQQELSEERPVLKARSQVRF